MMRFFQKTKGAISIFLVLIMLPMFTCAGLIVDGARISAARTAVSGAGDLAMNAALSEYDQIVKDVYGLFAMSEDMDELEENVSRYFSNTINNAGILEGSDSYTRSFINSIGSMFSTDEISFDNIVDTEVESFELEGVPDSALGNPTVLERQIVEYMKYRGPISLGSGLLIKLGCIGETSKQTKALEAKVDYEKKLDTVQDACETAYNAINAFNSAVDGSNYKDDYLTKMNEDLATAKSLTKEMAEYIIAAKSPSLEMDSLTVNSSLKNTVKNEVNHLSGENKKLQAYNLLKEKLKVYIEFEVNDEGEYNLKNTGYADFVNNYAGYNVENTLRAQMEYVLTIKANMDKLNEMNTYLKMLKDYYGELTSEERESLKKEYEAYFGVECQIVLITERAKGYPATWKEQANEKGRKAAELLYDKWYVKLSEIDKKLKDGIDALNAVLKKVDELDSARTTWGNKVNDLSDGDVKTSMQGDYKNSAKDINRDAVNALKTILQNNKSHFAGLKEKLESIKFYNQKICVNNSSSVNYFSRFSRIPEVSVGSYSDVSNQAESIMSNYSNVDVKSGITPATFQKVTEDQQFYKFLKNMCTSVTSDSDAKTEAEKNRNALINGNSEGGSVGANGNKTADVTDMTTGSYITTTGLTAEISAAIDALGQNQNTGAESFKYTALTSSKDNKDVADESKKNLTSISTMLENLGNIGETARDKVYLEEYFTEMFSCYTTGKGTEDVMSLNNKDMSSNKFYGSEIEYILYGFDTVEANLNASKASIFGVRFALNSIYALTSSDTRTPALSAATAIAGWTGFGVPIVQTVILLAWSMAESMVDVNNLCNGEAVVIYKSNDTWVLGVNGLINEAKEFASKAVGDIFDKIENVAIDAIGSLENEINGYVENTTNGVVDSIQGSIMSSMETLIVQIVGESNYNLTENDIGEKVDNLLNSIFASTPGDSTSEKATRLAIEAIKTSTIRNSENGQIMTIRDYIVSSIYSAYSDAKEGAVSSVSSKVEQILNSIADPIEQKITDTVSSLGEELKSQVSQIISEGGDQVKEKVTSAIEDYMGDLGGTDNGVDKTALASGFSLTYKEYLKAFTMISLIGNETSMLKRCAELIQANASQQDTSFDITQAYTMVKVNATVSIRTTFFDIPVTTGVDADGNSIYDLDFSNIGTGRQDIKYTGILGY